MLPSLTRRLPAKRSSSAGFEIRSSWKPYRDAIVSADVHEDCATDQLFVNGQRQTLARYPNLDPQSHYFQGYADDAFGLARARHWAAPTGGFVHAMHEHLWGDFHYVITGKEPNGAVKLDGGWQNNRRLGMHDEIRFVDNILEELDIPGEWFLDNIDLDDGSSIYRIENNLCLNGGIKLRDGFDRICENNIMVNNSFHPHVWFQGSDDVFRRNIVFTKYAPIEVPKPWGRECDDNFLHHPVNAMAKPALVLQEQSGRDQRSLEGDARFVDQSQDDFRVADDSPAAKLGFQNFPMDQFGVQATRLKRHARTPAPGLFSRVLNAPPQN
jgi:hypothetical protein